MSRVPLIILVLAAAACGTARVVSRTDAGGVIKLDGFRSAADREAEELMTARCGDAGYTIITQGEEFIAAIGKTEYRVHYACGGPPPVDAPDPRVPDANPIGLH